MHDFLYAADQGHQLFITEACAPLGSDHRGNFLLSSAYPRLSARQLWIQSIQPEEWQVPLIQRLCPGIPQKGTIKRGFFFFLFQCKFLNPFILEGDDIVIIVFL